MRKPQFIINNSLALGPEGSATLYKDTSLGRKHRSGNLKRKEITLFGYASPFFFLSRCVASDPASFLFLFIFFFGFGWWLFSYQGLIHFLKFISIIRTPTPYQAYLPTVAYLMSKQPIKRAEVQYHDKGNYHSTQIFLPFLWPRAHHVTCK